MDIREKLFKLLELFADKNKISGEMLLKRYRCIVGNEALVDFDKLIVSNYTETVKVIVETIAQDINTIVGNCNFETILDKELLSKYSQDNLVVVTMGDVDKFLSDIDKYKLSKGDESIEDFVKSFLGENYNKLNNALNLLDKISDMCVLKVEIVDAVKSYNVKLEVVKKYLDNYSNVELVNDNAFIPEIDKCNKYENTLDIYSMARSFNSELKPILIKALPLYNKYKNSLDEAIRLMPIDGSIAEEFRESFGKIISEFNMDLINSETFDFKLNYLKTLFSFYYDSFEDIMCLFKSYITAVEVININLMDVNYVIEVVSNNIKELNKK